MSATLPAATVDEMARAVAEAVAEQVAHLIDERQASRLVDTPEAAHFLGVPESWLATRARNGEAPCRRLGKYVRFDLAEVRAWIDSTTASGPVERTPPERNAA